MDVHEFNGRFLGQPTEFIMTSVIGHVFSLDFLPQFQSWENTDPKALFFAGTKKSEANPKV
jgi:DNA topoisomerase III